MTDYTISSKLSNKTVYACYRGRFWHWNGSIWKESRIMTHRFELARAADKNLTPQAFLTNGAEFAPLDEYEIDIAMLDALENAKPCKNAPIEPVEEPETAVVRATGTDVAAQCGNTPAAPSFDFGADDQTNALLLQDAQTFITGNMARIMAAKHAHDLCANNGNGTWGRWCNVVGISRDTGDNMVKIAEQFGNLQIDGQSIFDVRPMKLLYAAAKPSTPEEVKQAVFAGDITTYKEYQEVMAQLKAEKSRADTAETREEEARKAAHEYHEKYEEAAAMRATLLDQQGVYIDDIDGLKKQNAKLQQSYHDADESRIAANLQRQKAECERDRAEARAKDAENQLAGARQVAEAAKLRGDKLKAENDALKKQPITAVVDKDEVKRQAEALSRNAVQEARQQAAEAQARLRQYQEDAEGLLAPAQACAQQAQFIADSVRAMYLNWFGSAVAADASLAQMGTPLYAVCGEIMSSLEEENTINPTAAGSEEDAEREALFE